MQQYLSHLPSRLLFHLKIQSLSLKESTSTRYDFFKNKAYLYWLLYSGTYVCRFLLQSVLYSRNVSAGGNVVSIRAQVTTEAPAKVAKVSKKDDEGVTVNKFKPKNPYMGKCLLNTKITGDDAPGETWHMVFSTEGEFLATLELVLIFESIFSMFDGLVSTLCI